MPSAPLWKQRRLAMRAKRVQARRNAESPAISAYATTLHPKADAFIASFDTSARYEAEWRRKVRQGKASVAALRTALLAWLPLLARDVPAFISPKLKNGRIVADDVIATGGRVIAAVNEARDSTGAALTYRDEATQALEVVLATASADWAEAEAAESSYQKLLASTRATSAAFDAELKAFRQTLAATFGRNDKDFQRLRAQKITADKDEDEDEDKSEEEEDRDEEDRDEEDESEEDEGESQDESEDVEIPSVKRSPVARAAPE